MSRQIPLTFHPEQPEQFKRELDTLASSLQAYFATLTGQQHAAVVQRRLQELPLNSPKAAFGFVTPVTLPNSTDVLDIALPPPNPQNGGLMLAISRSTTNGTIHLSSPGCLVNGDTIATLANDVAIYPAWFIGGNYYLPPGSTVTDFG